MATRVPSGVGGASGEDAVGAAFQQVAQGLSRVQEALRVQEQQAERRAQEALRLQEQRAATALREAMQRLERERDDAVRALREQLQDRMRRVEDRMDVVEERMGASAGQEIETGGERMAMVEERLGLSAGHEGNEVGGKGMDIEAPRLDSLTERVRSAVEERLGASAGREGSEAEAGERMGAEEELVDPISGCDKSKTEGHASIKHLENRMQKLEAAVERALHDVFPRVEVLVTHLVKASPPEAPLAPPSTAITACPSPSASSSPSSALGATGGVAAVALEDPLNIERQKQRVELRIEELKARRDRARATPNPMGEDLCDAAFNGSAEDVRCLLDSGAPVNYTNCWGHSPLIAALSGRELNRGVVYLLLCKGAKVNPINANGWTALHHAASVDDSGHCVELVMGAGADVNARSRIGATPLHTAAINSNKAAVRLLLMAGAEKSLRIWSGQSMNKTPFDLAESDATRELLRF